MSTETMKETNCCGGNSEVNISIYANDSYRVEPIEGTSYGVINNSTNIVEVETKILAEALSTADGLELAVNKFFQGKAFDNVGDSVISTP